jgi:hypothetical protein
MLMSLRPSGGVPKVVASFALTELQAEQSDAQATVAELTHWTTHAQSRELWPNLGDDDLRKAAYRGGWKPA